MRKLILLLLIISLKSFGQTLETDRLALVDIYNAIPVENHADFTTWVVPGTPGDSPCGWAGVTCEGGRVTKLDLGNYWISAALPPQIGSLTALTYLDLRGEGNEFGTWEGDIPNEFGNLVNLEYLNLYGTRVGMANMKILGSLTKLKTLYITAYNPIPVEFTNLTNLEVLYLGTNEPMDIPNAFPFPLFLTTMTHLKELYLMSQIKGDIPPQIGNLSNLEVLVMQRNFELGSLPAEIGSLSKLKTLKIIQYEVPGPLPFQLTNLTNLEELSLIDTRFTGAFPADIGNLTKLKSLSITARMNGQLPAQLSTLADLNYLDLQYNSFTGPIPDLSNIPVAGHVNIANNAFNFDGMETNISFLDQYAPQALIKAYLEGPLCLGCIATGMLVWTAGGTKANNTYKLYKNNVLIQTLVGKEVLTLDGEGVYYAEVTNSAVPGLTLRTQTFVSIKLPVTLVSFEGKSEKNQIKLAWKTASEINNKGFEIERSADARTFEKIGFIDGSGDTKENQFYHFTDLNPITMGYYRLKQLDYDGKFEYSKVIAVKAGKEAINIYPNPAQTELTVTGAAGNELVSVFTSTGKPVAMDAKLSGGKFDVKDLNDVKDLKEGIYTIKIGDSAKKLLIKR
jgi:hypothetical protein